MMGRQIGLSLPPTKASQSDRAKRDHEVAQERVIEAVGHFLSHPTDPVYRVSLKARYQEWQIAYDSLMRVLGRADRYGTGVRTA